jgi:RNA polymerase sigma-70 factor (ECF subfamily)
MLFGKRPGGSDRQQRDAFERQAEQVFPSLYGTALRLTRSREDAEDLIQEAVVRAYEAFGRFDGTNFKAWMLRILTNLYINRYRQRRRGPSFGSLDDELVMEPAGDEELNPERLLLDGMLGQEVEEALARLPNEFRIAVLLSDIEGMSYQEVADATSVPIGTVRSRLARGRTMLRKQLKAYAEKEGFLRDGAGDDGAIE